MDIQQAIDKNDIETVRAWIASGAHIDRPLNPKAGFTPLHCAVLAGYVEVCRLLVDQGADIDKPTRNGMRPLDYALMHSRPRHDITRLLVDAGAALESPRGDRAPIISMVVRHGWRDVYQALVARGASLDAVDAKGETLLHHAAMGGRADLVEELAAAGLDPNALSSSGFTPLHHALYPHLHQSLATIAALVAAGANPSFVPNSPASYYLTPFQKAVDDVRFGAVEFFVANCREDPAQTTLTGRTMEQLAGQFDDMRSLLRRLKIEHSIAQEIACSAASAPPSTAADEASAVPASGLRPRVGLSL